MNKGMTGWLVIDWPDQCQGHETLEIPTAT